MNFQHVASLSENVRLGNVIYVVLPEGKKERERERERERRNVVCDKGASCLSRLFQNKVLSRCEMHDSEGREKVRRILKVGKKLRKRVVTPPWLYRVIQSTRSTRARNPPFSRGSPTKLFGELLFANRK